MMWEDTVRPADQADSPVQAPTSRKPETQRMDMDAVIAEVALAVGLAEGESGVRDILRVIARSEPVATRDIGRGAELPVPIVTAVCNELRKRGVVDNSRPVRLTASARELLAAGQPQLSAICPCCGGRGLVVPEQLAQLTAELELAAAGAPQARPELDQTHCTVATKVHRVLRMHESGALAGKRILLLGDDDLISVAIARFAALLGAAAGIRRLAVVDTDPAVLSWIGAQVAGTGIAVELAEHDLRLALPPGLRTGFDVVCTDPPYTVAGAELFLSRAVTALAPEPGQHVFFSFGARRPLETLRTQELIAALGLAVRSLAPGFNEYLGAGILAGTSNLYHLRSTADTAPLIDGGYTGPLYTADGRAAVERPYRCAGCGAVHKVGPGGQWQRIRDLQAAGCPQCQGTVFRPMALQQR
jgi:predicted methyltransferase